MPWRAKPAALGLAAVAGGVDMTVNALFLLAMRHGELALVAVLASLSAAQVLLALTFQQKRRRRSQPVGVALARCWRWFLIASG